MNIFFQISTATNNEALWTLCLAVGAGCLLTVLARKLNLPTIVLLLLGGFALGAEGLALISPDALGEFLPLIVSLAVGIILFEGGLTLDLKEFKHTSTVIKRLLTVGVLITWFGAALTAYLVFETTAAFALLMGSLIIVTGPTVIMPLLRRIRVQQRVGSILHWEAVLIDSVGVFIAILCFEWVVEGGSAVALPNFLLRIVSGAGLGVFGGYLIFWFMKRGWVPDGMVNGFALASAMLLFGATELVKPEAGLLSVTIAGLIIGIKKPRQLREVKAFKAEIVDLLIGLLFLLLVARLELQQFVAFFQNGGGWVLLSVIFLVRPISIALSAWGTSISFREKALLSWVAPRGVVAASMASLFAISLQAKDNPIGDPALLESFVYSVICATVLIQGLSAGVVARLLGVQRPPPNDWLILGAHHFGRKLASQIIRTDVQRVILLDTNARNIALARQEGLTAIHCDAMEAEKLYENDEILFGAGYVLALTDNIELNELLMQRWAAVLDSEKVFGWIPADSPSTEAQITGQSVFSDLSRPAVIGTELMQAESSFEWVEWEEGKSLPSGDWHPLFIRRNKQLRPVPQDIALKQMVKNEDEVICLRRAEGFLLRALKNGGLIQIDGDSLEVFHSSLAHTAHEKFDQLSEEKIIADLEAQARVFPALIGHGIAIPHVYCAELNFRVCIVAQLSSSLMIPGQSEAIDFVFFLLSPTGDTEGHLATLAEVAKTCNSAQLRERMKHAQKVEDIIAIVTR